MDFIERIKKSLQSTFHVSLRIGILASEENNDWIKSIDNYVAFREHSHSMILGNIHILHNKDLGFSEFPNYLGQP